MPPKQVADVGAALDGARAILVERFAEDADLIGTLREQMWSNGAMASTVRAAKKAEGEKFKDYFDFSEPLRKLPSHRILALFRGEKEEILDLQLQPEAHAAAGAASSYEHKVMQRFAISDRAPGDGWLVETARFAWRTKIQPHLSVDLRARLWTLAEPKPCACSRRIARPAAGGAGRRARHHGPRSWLPFRREGGGRRCHRQGGGYHGDLSA